MSNTFKDEQALVDWLDENHNTSKELWILIYKKPTGKLSIDWCGIVNACLRFNWIDSVKRRVDNDTYVQRITPRQKRSNWSERNINIYSQLLSKGEVRVKRIRRMTDKVNTYTVVDSNFKVATEVATKYGETIGLPVVLTVKTGGDFPRSSVNVEFGITLCDDPTKDKPEKVDIGVLVRAGGVCDILL